MISEDEHLERIVAGIQAVSSSGADVRWNEKINGRQFDVVVRFRLGTLTYLVLVEVKNRTRAASASDVEAFVTKARDQHANKAVFVTVAGFQQGALSVAERHGIDLFRIAFDAESMELSPSSTYIRHPNPDYTGPPSVPKLSVGQPTLTDVIEEVRLLYSDRRSFDVPSEASQMQYYMAKTMLDDGRVLGELVQKAPRRRIAEGKSRKEIIPVSPPVTLSPPDIYQFPPGTLVGLELTIFGRKVRFLEGNIGIEPTAFRSLVTYANIRTGEETRYSLDQLPLNSDSLLVGGYYVQLHPVRYFQCAAIKNGMVTWKLIESFQNCQLIRSTFTQEEKYGRFFVPVSDRKTLERLRGRLADYDALSAETGAVSLTVLPTSRKRLRRPKALRSR